MRASNCIVDPQYGKGVESVRFLLVGVGASDGDPPHQPLAESFVCNVEPVGTLTVGAALFGDPAQAVDTVNWFQGAGLCRPVAVIGPWMLFSARPVEKPQASTELEAAVAEVGGEMSATRR